MDEAADQEAVILWPEPEGWDFRVARAHGDLAQSHRVGGVMTVPLTSGLVAQIFGTQYMAMLYGFAFTSHQVGSFLGIWVGGVVFDLTGNYDIVWWSSIVLGFIAAIMHWPINESPVVRNAASPATS